MEEILLLKDRLDNIYNRVCSGNQGVFGELDELMLNILKYEDLTKYDSEEAEQIVSMIKSFTEKINLIYELLEVKRDNLLTMDKLREEFKVLEMKRFNIVNSYVMGMVRATDIEMFKNELFQFRDKLYAIPISDDEILEVAKMKSKIQHFNTEVLEDEDVLRVAYANMF